MKPKRLTLAQAIELERRLPEAFSTTQAQDEYAVLCAVTGDDSDHYWDFIIVREALRYGVEGVPEEWRAYMEGGDA